jgi:acyl-CoA thioesterase-1
MVIVATVRAAARVAGAAKWTVARIVDFMAVAVVAAGIPLAAHAAAITGSIVDASQVAVAARPSIVVLGDSLSAEYGLARGTGWVALLRQRLAQTGSNYDVINASISGDTTSDGRARLPAILARAHPAIVIIELGGNDALRGIPLAVTVENMQDLIARSRAAGAKVLLVGMQIPSNYGPDYTQKFRKLYPQLAQQTRVALAPFLLDGLADQPQMFQADQIHPIEAAQPKLLDNVYPALKPLLTVRRQ